MKIIFWISFSLFFYTYIGYPILLVFLGLFGKNEKVDDEPFEPGISMIIPVYNEEKIIESKIKNILSLNYPNEKLQAIIVSDASTDSTRDIIEKYVAEGLTFFALPERQGKVAALNRGLKEAQFEIVVFSDASIMLASDGLHQIVKKFQSEKIGCVSGEDYIPGGGGEGAYGKYELFLRNLESRVGSIVGASGCFYAQRRSLCEPFQAGMAPDFLSVLTTVEKGFRAVTEPRAVGAMGSSKRTQQEFGRKVRTLIRGITTLMHFKHLLTPFRYGMFAIELISHKIMRWSAAIFMIVLSLSNLFLLETPLYLLFFILQIAFYTLAFVGWISRKNMAQKLLFKIPLYFCMVNISALIAWLKYLNGTRQEIWEPTKR